MRKIVFVAVVCAFMSVPSRADITMEGPFIGNSWTITCFAGGTYDLWAVRISPGYEAIETFDVGAPALQNGGWSTVLDTPLLASIAGPAGSLSGSVQFAGGAPPALLEIDHALFNGQTKVIETHWVLANGSIYNSGGNWWHSNDWNPTRAEVVPVPGAVLLGMLGLSVVGVKLRKFA